MHVRRYHPGTDRPRAAVFHQRRQLLDQLYNGSFGFDHGKKTFGRLPGTIATARAMNPWRLSRFIRVTPSSGCCSSTTGAKDQFTIESIQFFEGLGAAIGIAMARKKAEEELRPEKHYYVDTTGNVHRRDPRRGRKRLDTVLQPPVC